MGYRYRYRYFFGSTQSIYLKKEKAKHNHAMLCFLLCFARYHGDLRSFLLEKREKRENKYDK